MGKHSVFGLFALALAVLAGCAHGPRHVYDDAPDDKIPAIKQAARQRDKSAIPQLVKDLDNDDPAIRFYAIDALHTLTGQTYGYRYFDDDEVRKPAVERWKRHLAGADGIETAHD